MRYPHSIFKRLLLQMSFLLDLDLLWLISAPVSPVAAHSPPK